MKKYFLLIGFEIFFLFFSRLGLAQSIKQTEPNGEPTLTFQIKVSDFGGLAYPILRGKKPDDIIEISLSGELLNPPKEVEIISKQSIDRTTPEKAAVSRLSANKSYDVEWMIENWAPEDRNEIKAFFEDQEVFRKNQEFFKTIFAKQFILGKVTYKEYVILLARDDYKNGKSGVPRVYPYINVKNGWRETNALAADETLAVVEATLRLWDNKWLTQTDRKPN